MNEKENIDEETEETVKITNRIIKAGNSSTYEKKVMSKIITKEGPNDTTIIKTSNFINENSSVQNHNKATYTRPLNKAKYKHKNKKNKLKNNLPKANINGNSSFQNSRNIDDSPNKTFTSSQSFGAKKIYLFFLSINIIFFF